VPTCRLAEHLSQVAVSRHQEPWRTVSELPETAAPHTKLIFPVVLVTTSALTSMDALAEFAAVVLKELTAILRFCGDPDVGMTVQPDAPVVSVPPAYTSRAKPVEAFPVAFIAFQGIRARRLIQEYKISITTPPVLRVSSEATTVIVPPWGRLAGEGMRGRRIIERITGRNAVRHRDGRRICAAPLPLQELERAGHNTAGLPAVYNDAIMSRPQTRRYCSSPAMPCVSAISAASWRRGYEGYLEKWGD
jgi:hypothetical protein